MITSSAPPRFAAMQEALFREVLCVLEKQGVPFAISGAFALHQCTGIWRQTKDLDIFLKSEDASVALSALRKHGFACEVPDPVWLAKAHRGDFFVDLITGMSNAVITVDDSWIERAIPAVILGLRTRVLAPEELLASKLFVTRRDRFDGADIAHIIFRTGGLLEWDRLQQLVGEHWHVLLWALLLFAYVYPAHTSLVPRHLWRDLLNRLRNGIENPDPSAPFRGSLIDENMFAIDVTEWGMADLLSELRALREPKIHNCPPHSGTLGQGSH